MRLRHRELPAVLIADSSNRRTRNRITFGRSASSGIEEARMARKPVKRRFMFDFFMPDGRVYDCRPGWMHQLMTDTTITNFHEDSGFRRSVYCRKRQKLLPG